MIDKLFICYETLSRFQQDLNAGNIKSTSIVFIEQTHQIYTNGTYYGEFDNSIGPNGGLSNDQHLILSSDQIKWLFTTFANLNGLQTPWVEYTISYTGDTNAIKVNWVNPEDSEISGGSRFDAHITVNENGGYSQEMIVGITCTMGGESIVVDEVTGGWDIHISNVTGNIVIDVESTDKPYTYSIEDLDGGDESIVSSPALNERFAEGDEFQTTISIANGYEFTYVIAHMNGYVNPNTHDDVIYQTSEGEVSSLYTIPEHEINVTGNISVQYHKRPKTYPINLGESLQGHWTWYRDAAQQEELSESIMHTYGTDTVFYVFGNENYNVTSVNVDVTQSDQQQYVDYDPNTGEVTISGECASELTLSADASMQYPQLINYLTGFTLVVSQNDSIITPTPTNLEPNTEYTFTVTLPQNYEVGTAPTINSNTMSPKSGSEGVYEEAITVGTSNITINGTATAIVPKIIYGKVPASITGFDSTTFNNGGCKVSHITSTDIEDAISDEYLTVGTPDIDKIPVNVNAYDYIICLIDTSYTNKSSKLWYQAVNQYAAYNFNLPGYQDNGNSTITIDDKEYKIYAQFSLMSDTVQMSVKNTNEF